MSLGNIKPNAAPPPALPPEAREQLVRAQALLKEGKAKEAEHICSEIIRRFPNNFAAINQLGLMALRAGQYQRAAQLLSRAVEMRPQAVQTHLALGDAYKALKKPKMAVESYSKAIRLKADLPSAYNARGLLLLQGKRALQALADFDKAISLKSDTPRWYCNRGHALRALKRPQAALENYDKAIAMDSSVAMFHLNRGATLMDMHRTVDALASYEIGVKLDDKNPAAHFNVANALRDLGNFEGAIESYDRAIAIKSDYTPALWNQANCLLQIGDYERGLRNYEHRTNRKVIAKKRPYEQPSLLAEHDVNGKTVFIYPELYLGDMLQFCRYVRVAESRGAKVILSAQSKLHRLLRTLSPTVEIVAEDFKPEAFDFHCPLMSLPFAFGTTLSTIPAEVPYLHAEEERIEKWRKHIGDEGIKIGICWQGSKAAYAERLQRAFSALNFRNISKIPNVRLISLQKPDDVDPVANLPKHLKIESLGPDYDAGEHAFLDCAAVMQCLDLVITTDTGLAHLAGALARPTWVVLRKYPDWRWLLDRSDCPWYPTARLFRQNEINDWVSAFAQMETAIVETFGERVNAPERASV